MFRLDNKPSSEHSDVLALKKLHNYVRGTTAAQWLRCCVTNLKVAGSIPAGVIGIFH